jgi:putative tryptophan/tyrosine transport system substrate-binding protein
VSVSRPPISRVSHRPSLANEVRVPDAKRRIEAFLNSLKEELGWIDGRNAAVDVHLAPGDATDVRSAISAMVGLRPDVILATATNVLSLLRPVAPGTPIVFVLVSDPVGQGFVDSLAHPGGRITGFTSFEFSMSGKWLEALKEMVPHITRAALIFNPETAPYGEKYFGPLQSAAQLLGVEPLVFRVHSLEEVEKTLASFVLPQGSRRPYNGASWRGDRIDGCEPFAEHLRLSFFCNPGRADFWIGLRPER